MRFGFSEEQQELVRRGRRFLERYATSERVRAAMASEAGFDREAWSRISGELGWPALAIPEAYGGAGFGIVELAAVMEELGRALLPSPFFATVCLGATAILEAGTEAQRAARLPGLAAGTTLATLAHDGAAEARLDGSGFRLDGVLRHVVDGATAALLVLPARAGGELGLFLVEAGAPGLERRALPTLDRTRRLGEVRLRGTPAERLGEGDASAALARTLDLAAILLAAEQVGGADRCLEMAVEYGKLRVQFGRPIGSFQAVKHRCADLLVQVESARSAAHYAAWAASAGDPELPVLAALARAYCAEAFFAAAAENIQLHGGIGFTWEHDAHLYLKRARAGEALLGRPDACRERIARHLGLEA